MMTKRSLKVTSKTSGQSSSTSSVSSLSQLVTSAVQKKEKAIVQPFKRVKSTMATHSGSSTAFLDSLNSDDEATNEKTAESIHSDDSSVIELAESDPAKELGEG
jgi:hypothetical protein